MLQWEYGFFKSTILKQIASWFPIDANFVSSASAAALRGSFNENKFFPPELLISDIMIFSELGSVIKSDKETVGQLLVAAEEADVRVAIVKGGNLSEMEKTKVREYGADIIDGRLCYRNSAVIWTATHQIDSLSEDNRDAFLSRFYLVQLDASDIPKKIAWQNPKHLLNPKLETKVADWLEKTYQAKTMPDHVFGDKTLEIIADKYINTRKRPREVGDIRRMIFAHHVLFPTDTEEEVAMIMKDFLNAKKGETSRDKIANFIYQHPRTAKEIATLTSLTTGTIFNHLKRLSASSIGSNPRKYYLDSAPKPTKHGGQRKNSGRKKGSKNKQNNDYQITQNVKRRGAAHEN